MSDLSTKQASRFARAIHNRLRVVSPRIRVLFAVAGVVALVLVVVAICAMGLLLSTYAEAGTMSAAYDRSERAAQELMDTSDYLTAQARQYVSSGTRHFMDDYLAELYTVNRRGKAVEVLKGNATNSEAATALENAMARSDDLAQIELRAMRLAADAYGLADQPAAIAQVELSEEDESYSPEQKLNLAHAMVFDYEYTSRKLSIGERVQSCSNLLVGTLRESLDRNREAIEMQLGVMRASVILLLADVVFIIVCTNYLLLWPMLLHEKSVRQGEPLELAGAQELRTLTTAYNEMYEKTSRKTELLQHEAKSDALTGILNRASYDRLLSAHRHDSALILIDVDNFKNFNDDYGHEMGDAILIEVAATLHAFFRSNDHICRIGGDEFAVIMESAGPELQDVIARKLTDVADFLRDTSNGLPCVTISVGVAFGAPDMGEDELFKAADTALYATKRRGRDGYSFYGT